MKATFTNVAIALAVLALVLTVLTAVDHAANVDVDNGSETYLRVTVVDLDGNPVHNAQISVGEQSFFADNKGLSPNILLADLTNVYDSAETQWRTVNVVVKKDGYVAAVVLNCVVYTGQTRRLTVKMYPQDSSDLPYVCYVESPPHEFLKELVTSF